MSIRKLSYKRLVRFWGIRLPGQDQLFERFARSGLCPRDCSLTPLELVCACSFMLDTGPIFDVYRSIDRLKNECIEPRFEDEFFQRLNETISEMENAGMRDQPRQLRKLGRGLAALQQQGSWHTHWEMETDRKLGSTIKDEPFLPQRG